MTLMKADDDGSAGDDNGSMILRMMILMVISMIIMTMVVLVMMRPITMRKSGDGPRKMMYGDGDEDHDLKGWRGPNVSPDAAGDCAVDASW